MDIKALDKTALTDFCKLVTALTEPQLGAAAPCTGWTVRGLLDHMNTEHEAISQLLLNDTHVLDPDPRAAFGRAADRWLKAFASDELLDQHITVPEYGSPIPVDSYSPSISRTC